VILSLYLLYRYVLWYALFVLNHLMFSLSDYNTLILTSTHWIIQLRKELKCKGKAISVQPLRVPVGWGFQVSKQMTHKGGKSVSLMHCLLLPSRKYSCYSFLLGAVLTPGPKCSQKIMLMKNFHWHHREFKPWFSGLQPSASSNCTTACPLR
jgi:hypothetical protein